MRIAKFVTAFTLVAASISAVSCNSTGSASGSGGGAAARVVGEPDAPGTQVLPGVVTIADIDRSAMNTEGIVRYYIDNVSGEDQEDLVYFVQFFRPPTASGIKIEFLSEPTTETPLVLFKSDRRREIAVRSDDAATWKDISTTRLTVNKMEAVPTVAREGSQSGTTFLNGALECTGFQGDFFQAEPALALELTNVSEKPATDLEIRVVFKDGKNRKETDWKRLAPMKPGQSMDVSFDLSGMGREVRGICWVQVRPAPLF